MPDVLHCGGHRPSGHLPHTARASDFGPHNGTPRNTNNKYKKQDVCIEGTRIRARWTAAKNIIARGAPVPAPPRPKLPKLWTPPRGPARSRPEKSDTGRKVIVPDSGSRAGVVYVGVSKGRTHPGLFTVGCSFAAEWRDHGRNVEEYTLVGTSTEFPDKRRAESVMFDHLGTAQHAFGEWFIGDGKDAARYAQSAEFVAKVKKYTV